MLLVYPRMMFVLLIHSSLLLFVLILRPQSRSNMLQAGGGGGGGQPTPFATSYMVGGEDKRTNNRTMIPTLKNNAAAGYQGPAKTELLKGAGLLTS